MASLQKNGKHEEVLARLTRELAQCCIAKESEIFHRFGLSTGEGNVLLAVVEGAASPSALAERMGVVRSRITPLVQSLVEKGFIERLESTSDRRVRDLRLSPAGERLARNAERYRLDFHRRLLDRFEEGDRRQLLQTLSVLHERMTEVRKALNIHT